MSSGTESGSGTLTKRATRDPRESPSWYFKRAQALNKERGAAKHIKASAVVGVNKLNALLLNFYIKFTGENLHAVPTESEGLAWLEAACNKRA